MRCTICISPNIDLSHDSVSSYPGDESSNNLLLLYDEKFLVKKVCIDASNGQDVFRIIMQIDRTLASLLSIKNSENCYFRLIINATSKMFIPLKVLIISSLFQVPKSIELQ